MKAHSHQQTAYCQVANSDLLSFCHFMPYGQILINLISMKA